MARMVWDGQTDGDQPSCWLFARSCHTSTLLHLPGAARFAKGHLYFRGHHFHIVKASGFFRPALTCPPKIPSNSCRTQEGDISTSSGGSRTPESLAEAAAQLTAAPWPCWQWPTAHRGWAKLEHISYVCLLTQTASWLSLHQAHWQAKKNKSKELGIEQPHAGEM